MRFFPRLNHGFEMNEFELGLQNRRRVLGETWVEKSLSEANAFTAEFQALISRHAWSEVWGRKHSAAFDDKTRRLLVLAMTFGLGRYEEFALHVKAALNATDASALTIDDVKELIHQGAVYCGVPAANTAMHVVSTVLRETNTVPPALHVVRSVDVTADRPTLVLSHALGHNHTMWDSIMPALSARYTVIRYDHRGQGASQKSNREFGIDALADDAAGVILREVFSKGAGPVHFVGLSMGGMVAQALAARYPHLVKSIVVANSAMRYDDTARALWRARVDTVSRKGMEPVVEMALSRWFTPEFRASNSREVDRVVAILRANDPVAYARTCSAISMIEFDATNSLIRCPTLVIAGARDAATPPELSAAIHKSIAQSKLVTLDAAHISVAELPTEFSDAVLNFLSTLTDA
jgi:3-oxoadipate enol-lactonase